MVYLRDWFTRLVADAGGGYFQFKRGFMRCQYLDDVPWKYFISRNQSNPTRTFIGVFRGFLRRGFPAVAPGLAPGLSPGFPPGYCPQPQPLADVTPPLGGFRNRSIREIEPGGVLAVRDLERLGAHPFGQFHARRDWFTQGIAREEYCFPRNTPRRPLLWELDWTNPQKRRQKGTLNRQIGHDTAVFSYKLLVCGE